MSASLKELQRVEEEEGVPLAKQIATLLAEPAPARERLLSMITQPHFMVSTV